MRAYDTMGHALWIAYKAFAEKTEMYGVFYFCYDVFLENEYGKIFLLFNAFSVARRMCP